MNFFLSESLKVLWMYRHYHVYLCQKVYKAVQWVYKVSKIIMTMKIILESKVHVKKRNP